jgi:hypothetical protein
MPTPLLSPARLRKSGLGAFFRPRDIAPLGVSFPDLQRLVAEGAVDKVGPGLYRLAAAEPDELETLAMVSSAIPNGIVCLISALRVHNIGTQAPHEVWLALDRKARKPSRPPARVRIVRFSGAMLTYGIQDRFDPRRSGARHVARPHRSGLLPLPAQARPRCRPRSAAGGNPRACNEYGRDHARRRGLPRPHDHAHLPGGAFAVTKRPITNVAASMRDWLRDRSRQTGESFQASLIQQLNEICDAD